MTNEIASSIYHNALLFTFIAGMLTLLCFYAILKIRKKPIRERLDLNKVSWKKLWPILPLGVTLNLFLEYTISLLPISEGILDEYAQASGIISRSSTLQMILATVIMAPILEEVLFRGLIFKSLRKGMPWHLALILQALLFGVMHGQIIWISYATVIGIILGSLQMRYRSLFAPLILHFSVNVSNLFITPLKNAVDGSMVLFTASFASSILLSVIFARMIVTKTEPVIELAIEDVPVSVPYSDL
jgi:membrane protease YdiL (CAAX protease family)